MSGGIPGGGGGRVPSVRRCVWSAQRLFATGAHFHGTAFTKTDPSPGPRCQLPNGGDSSSGDLDFSPEQACGEPVDKPANIRAFGIVLHERLPGVFGGNETVTDTLAAVVNETSHLGKLP